MRTLDELANVRMGDMTREERHLVTERAVDRLQAELNQPAVRAAIAKLFAPEAPAPRCTSWLQRESFAPTPATTRRLYEALQVILQSDTTRAKVAVADPKAYLQACNAVEAYDREFAQAEFTQMLTTEGK